MLVNIGNVILQSILCLSLVQFSVCRPIFKFSMNFEKRKIYLCVVHSLVEVFQCPLFVEHFFLIYFATKEKEISNYIEINHKKITLRAALEKNLINTYSWYIFLGCPRKHKMPLSFTFVNNRNTTRIICQPR